jgi:hypothetical protein
MISVKTRQNAVFVCKCVSADFNGVTDASFPSVESRGILRYVYLINTIYF